KKAAPKRKAASKKKAAPKRKAASKKKAAPKRKAASKNKALITDTYQAWVQQQISLLNKK
ncbi:MAG: hypothetical protein CMO13_02560, partial [Thaumarchaeota archaeon]|nr:hypothetical protein [Nitrososphaerota archaeon]